LLELAWEILTAVPPLFVSERLRGEVLPTVTEPKPSELGDELRLPGVTP
jgi:hypothetical protein